ncbi:MAG: DUF6868 family protein [Smithella sp.]
MNKVEQIYWMENLAGIFIRCFFLSFALLLISVIFYMLAGNLGYTISSNWYGFALSRHDYDLIFCYGLAFIKICAIIFFLFPYIAIKLVLRNRLKMRVHMEETK